MKFIGIVKFCSLSMRSCEVLENESLARSMDRYFRENCLLATKGVFSAVRFSSPSDVFVSIARRLVAPLFSAVFSPPDRFISRCNYVALCHSLKLHSRLIFSPISLADFQRNFHNRCRIFREFTEKRS